MAEQDLRNELVSAREEIRSLRVRLDALESRSTHLPSTMLLDDSFLKRAFTVLGHYFVASLVIVVPIYALVFLVGLVGWVL